MSTTLTSHSTPTTRRLPWAARQVLRLLERLQVGSLDLQGPDGQQWHFGQQAEPRAALRLMDWQVCAEVMKSGDVAFGEAYRDGRWSSPDLCALLRLLIVNRQVLEQAIYGSKWGSLVHRLRHLMRRNSRAGSRRNIHAHYDLGNPFYQLWLDESMNYSSAWFAGDHSQPLQAAQQAKMRRALQACRVEAGHSVLEIGCGWGAVAQTAVQDVGAKLLGVTLSTEQLAYAQQRLAALPQGDLATLRLQDYRDIPEQHFDAVVSIEMFEAVGQAYWPRFFQTVTDKLKPGGRACIQTITIDDRLFERYLQGTDFIQQYIFPGGCLPSPSAFRQQARQAGLNVVDELAFGPDYAETLRRWRADFMRHEQRLQSMGYDDAFRRLWEFYLAYCEAAFDEGTTNVMQFTLERPL